MKTRAGDDFILSSRGFTGTNQGSGLDNKRVGGDDRDRDILLCIKKTPNDDLYSLGGGSLQQSPLLSSSPISVM